MRPLGPGRANPRPWQAREDVDPFRPPAKAGGRSSFLGKKISPRRGRGKIFRRGENSLPLGEGGFAKQRRMRGGRQQVIVCRGGACPRPYNATPEVHASPSGTFLTPPAGNSGKPLPGPGPEANAACFPPWRRRCFPAEAFAESSHAPPRCPPDGPDPPGKTAGTGG